MRLLRPNPDTSLDLPIYLGRADQFLLAEWSSSSRAHTAGRMHNWNEQPKRSDRQ